MMASFHSINYERVPSTDDEDSELPPAFVTTRGAEKNGRWNHIENLDDFFIRVYDYFHHHGFACLLLTDISVLVQYVFVVLFTTFLYICIDYKELFDNPNPEFSKVIDWKKFEHMPSGLVMCILVAFTFWLVRLGKVIHHAIKGWEIRQFYYQALHVTDSDLQNMQWRDVQQKLIHVQRVHHICIHKQELTELDIHHRILRQKNYMIAMQNKNVIPCVYTFPFIGERTFLTEGLKYNLRLILFKGPGAPFQSSWKIRSEYKDSNFRVQLANQLSQRIFLLGIVNLALCPFIFIYQVLHSFFTYAELIKRSPDTFGARKWSLYGRLYLRHFNELDHEFHSRLSKAYEPARKYMDSFTSPIMTILCRNIAFFAGAILAVLLGLSFYDQDVLTAEHVISFMATLGIIIKVCAGFIPDEHLLWCPGALMKQILSHTHYIPDHWKGKAHTNEVREQFSRFFQYKFIYLIEELLSPLLTPFILCFVVRYQAQQIIDFFRNFTVDVVGVGDVCSFAQMDIRRHGNNQWHLNEERGDDRAGGTRANIYDIEEEQAENGKTELSLLHFSIKNPTWQPTESGKQFIETIKEQAIQESLSMSMSMPQPGTYSNMNMAMPSLGSRNDLTNFIGLESIQYPATEAPLTLQRQESLMANSILYIHEAHERRRLSISSPTMSSPVPPDSNDEQCPVEQMRQTWPGFEPREDEGGDAQQQATVSQGAVRASWQSESVL